MKGFVSRVVLILCKFNCRHTCSLQMPFMCPDTCTRIATRWRYLHSGMKSLFSVHPTHVQVQLEYYKCFNSSLNGCCNNVVKAKNWLWSKSDRVYENGRWNGIGEARWLIYWQYDRMTQHGGKSATPLTDTNRVNKLPQLSRHLHTILNGSFFGQETVIHWRLTGQWNYWEPRGWQGN